MRILTIILFLFLSFPLVCSGQIINSVGKSLTELKPVIGSKITLQKSQPLVTVKEVEYVGIDGKAVIQKVAENDVGITVHHHYTKCSEIKTIVKMGNTVYKGTSVIDKDGNIELTVKEVLTKVEVKK